MELYRTIYSEIGIHEDNDTMTNRRGEFEGVLEEGGCSLARRAKAGSQDRAKEIPAGQGAEAGLTTIEGKGRDSA